MQASERCGYRRILQLLLPIGIGSVAFGHGFGQRYDLPVPLGMYLGGAAATVLLSFVVVAFFVGSGGVGGDYRRSNLLASPIGRALLHPFTLGAIRTLSVAVFLLTLATALFGSRSPSENFAPVMVWVVWWVGLTYASALLGNVWTLLNPWAILFEGAERIYRRFDTGGNLSLDLSYPRWLGRWPAVLLFLAFAWVEIVMPGSALPRNLAPLILAYSLITWWGMLTYGKWTWLRNGEAFSVAFGLLAKFAPSEVRVSDSSQCEACSQDCQDSDCVNCYSCFSLAEDRHRELNLRPFAVGLLDNRGVRSSTIFFVLVMLAAVTYDGFTATPAWAAIQLELYSVLPSITGIATLGLGAFILLFLAVYLLFCRLMIVSSGTALGLPSIARAFAFTLLPIALGYHLAHYLTYLLTQGQLVIPLLSDPFGYGWDLLNTASHTVNLNVVGAKFAWYVAVLTIVAGHVIAVYLAHVIALRSMGDRRTAARSQYPMLVLMVAYTVVSLWILAQPIVEPSAG